jgi:transposase
VMVMQFAENLSDHQATDIVHSRIAWKYTLSLPLMDEGFDYSVLIEFRNRLMEGEAGQVLLYKLLALHMNRLPEHLRLLATAHLIANREAREWHLSAGFVEVS